MKSMKSFIFNILLLIACVSAQAETDNQGCRGELHQIILKNGTNLQELVEKAINKALKVVESNDPFTISHVDLNYNSYGIKSKGYLSQLILASISTTKITNIVVEDDTSLNFKFDLSMDKFKVIGTYDLDFDIFTMFPVYGSGNLGLLLKGLGVKFSTSLMATEDNILQMTDLNIKTSLQESMVQLENLFNNTNLGTYMSQILSDMLPRAINDGEKVLSFANIGLKSLLNEVMCDNKVTLDVVIDALQQFIA